MRSAIETSAVSAPCAAALRSFAMEVRGQVPLDQLAHVGECHQLHNLGDDQRPRQRT
jgi:hypothetical protein